MKIFTSVILAIACAIILVFGNIYWDAKIEDSVESSTGTQQIASENAPKNSVNQKTDTNNEELLSYASNWPESSQELFKQKLKDEKPFTILFVGSDSMAADENGWPNAVKEQLTDSYGSSVIVKIKQYDLNTMEFVQQNKQQEIADEKADLVIFEPFTLSDNGVVNNSDTLDNIETIITDVKAEKKNTTFILQSPNPLYNAVYYPQQINELKEFAADNEITYLDHWTVWPDSDSEGLKDFLAEDQRTPNEKGHQVWGTYIQDYLIRE